MLDRFLQAKHWEIEWLRQLEADRKMPARFRGFKPGFARALIRRGPGAVIAEYKLASPSRGAINRSLAPEIAGRAFARAGAAAASVLTEEQHFGGSLRFLDAMAGCGLPLLRKDFILDPLQIRFTGTTPASAVLLVARYFANDPQSLRNMVREARRESLEPVVEIIGRTDLELARCTGADIIQVNNRDLDTLRVDRSVSRELIGQKRAREVWISASGMHSGPDIREMAALGFEACLVGTSIMACPDPEGHLLSLATTGNCSACGAATNARKREEPGC